MTGRIALVIVFALGLGGVASADSLKGGYYACLSEDLFDEIITAATKHDDRAVQYLLEHGCIITKGGIPISVLDTSWLGTAKVRVYVGDESVILWTNSENIQR